MIQNKYEHHLALSSNNIQPYIYHKASANMNYTLNWHKNLEVLLVEKGNGYIKYDGEDYALEPGNIVIINSGAMHGIYSDEGIFFHCVIISENFLKENCLDAGNTTFSKIVNNKTTEEVYLGTVAAIEQYTLSPTPINTATMRKQVLELAIELYSKHIICEESRSKTTSRSYDCIKKAITFISDNFTRELSLDEISDYVGVSKYHMAREFKKFTGQTPITYINILRCKKAKTCILEGMSVTETAIECGFESISYFSRTYKKVMGKSPSFDNKNTFKDNRSYSLLPAH